MEPYRNFSVEELRLADYARGDKGSDQPTNPNAFASAFGQPSSSAFGFQQSASAFGAAFGASSSAFGGANSVFGASSSAFGAPSTNQPFGSSNPSAPSNPFGGSLNSAFGATTNTAFGAGSSAFGANAQSSPFGAAQNSFGSGGLGASSSAFGGGMSAFGAASSSASLFGASTGGNIFGGGQSQGGLFGSSSSAMGASGAFGGPFGGSAPTQTAPSLFGGSNFGSFGASTASTGSGLFGNTGTSLFGTGGGLFGSSSSIGGGGMFGASNGSSLLGGVGQTGFGSGLGSTFGSGFGGLGFNNPQSNAQHVQQAQGPLEASLTNSPFGDSKLFSGAAANGQSAQNKLGISVVNTAGNTGQTQQKSISVVVNPSAQAHRRTRGSDLLARQTVMQKSNLGTGWFAASPMRPWGESGSVFNVGSALRTQRDRRGGAKPRGLASYVYPWRTEEQMTKAANLKRLVIEPVQDETTLQHSSSALRTEEEHNLGGSGGGQRRHSTNDVTARAKKRESTGSVLRQTSAPNSAAVANEDEGTREMPAPSFPPSQTGNHANSEEPRDKTSPQDAATDKRQDGAVGDGTDDGRNLGAAKPSTTKASDHPSAEKGTQLAQYTPYSDFYRRQMSASRDRSSIGSSERRNSRRGSGDTPICTNSEYYMSPSLEELSKMSSEDLSQVEEFTIGRKARGEILWLEPVDLRGLNLDDVVEIKTGEISVYPRDKDVPPVGQGLNKPARVKLLGIHKFNKHTKEPLTDASTAARMVQKLKAHCEKGGLRFLGYDIKTGTWIFEVSSF